MLQTIQFHGPVRRSDIPITKSSEARSSSMVTKNGCLRSQSIIFQVADIPGVTIPSVLQNRCFWSIMIGLYNLNKCRSEQSVLCGVTRVWSQFIETQGGGLLCSVPNAAFRIRRSAQAFRTQSQGACLFCPTAL